MITLPYNRLAALCCAFMMSMILIALPAFSQERTDYRLSPGDSVVVNTDFDILDIIVGADAVASAVPLSRNSFVIQTRAVGRTAIVVLNETRNQQLQLDVVVQDNFGDLESILNSLDPGNRIKATNVNGRVLLRGTVKGEAQRAKVLGVANSYSEAPVLDSMRVVDPRQVMLRVNVLELSRSGGKDLGISLFEGGQNYEGLNGTPFGSFNGSERISSALLGDFDLNFILQALEVKGLAKRLANPTLVTVNGQEANFVVGGEVPITTAVENEDGETTGSTSTGYREYGVKLAFTPVIMDQGTVRLSITPEVSEVDWSRRVDDNPAFVTRKVTTTVELKSGTSFAIAGLLTRNTVRSLSQFPWLGDIPLLGALFRSSAYQNNETELVVIVTPLLVNTNSPQIKPYDPRRQSPDASEAEMFLLGLIESTPELRRRFLSGIGANGGAFGHILPHH